MNKPLVSIIIRTCGRPQVLGNALKSVRNQTYQNIEVVIIEDGKNISEELVRHEFSDLNIVYANTGEKKGRCYVGNLGLSKASGEYFNFLDDDDILLANHVEILMDKLLLEKCEAAYSIAEEHQITITNVDEYRFKIKRKVVRYKQPFNKLLLCYMNYMPIQSVMFSRRLYDTLGGFDEQLHVLEDWDLWVRYTSNSTFIFVPEKTSVYYTPYKGNLKRKREIDLKSSTNVVIKKYSTYHLSMTVDEINREMEYILNVFNKKGILFYMQKVRNFLLYRDI